MPPFIEKVGTATVPQRACQGSGATLDIAKPAHRAVHEQNSMVRERQIVECRADFRRRSHALALLIAQVCTTLEDVVQ
jgi:hypothetical protein